jgi:phytoene dehydrogenase-like protein
MKIASPRRSILFQVALLLALACVFGCKSSDNYQQADRTGTKIRDLRRDIVAIHTAVMDTQTALDLVVQSANTDPRKPYKQFTKTVTRLEDANERAKRRAEDMRAEGRVFFEQWQQEIAALKNPELQQLAQDRKTTLEQTFRSISRYTVEAKDQFRPWFTNVKDLQRFLGSDLSVSGIYASRTLIDQTRANAAKVTQALQTLIDELNSLDAAMTPTREKPNRGSSG